MKKLAILLVDVEEKYTNPDELLEHIIDGDLDPLDVADSIKEKYREIAEFVSNSKDSDVFITHKNKLHNYFQGLGTTLPPWEVDFDSKEIHPAIINALKHYPNVLVCGIYLERCVSEVSRRLNIAGINTSVEAKYCVSSKLIGEYLDQY